MDGVRVAKVTAQMHGEFELPGHRLDDASGGNLIAITVEKRDLDMGAFLKGRDLKVDAHAPAVGILLRAQGGNARFFGSHASLKVVFGGKEIHRRIITKRRAWPCPEFGQLDYSFISCDSILSENPNQWIFFFTAKHANNGEESLKNFALFAPLAVQTGVLPHETLLSDSLLAPRHFVVFRLRRAYNL